MVTNQYDNPSVYAGWRSVKLSGSGTRLIAKAVGQKMLRKPMKEMSN